MRINPFIQVVVASVLCFLFTSARSWAADEQRKLESAFADALYAEEVKGDIEAALKAYQKVSEQFQQQRELAAKALFRQAECLRKLKRPEEASALYQGVIRLYPDSRHVARLARENLAALGVAVTPSKPPGGGPGNGIVIDEEATEIARLKKLVENSPDLLNGGSPHQLPPLHEAAIKGQLRVATFLLEQGADINIVARFGPEHQPPGNATGLHPWEGTALHAAARSGHKAIVELLLDRGDKVDRMHLGQTPLLHAIEGKRRAVALTLLERGADLELPGEGKTPLLQALNYDVPIVPELLKRGADPNVGEAYVGSPVNWSPNASESFSGHHLGKAIHMAVDSASVDVVKLLLEAGADSNAKTTISISSSQRTVARSGGNYSAKEPYPLTPLAIAAENQDLEKVQLLLKAKADPNNAGVSDIASPLLLALGSSPQEDPAGTANPVMNALLDAGAKWNSSDENGHTVLHIAVVRNFPGWIRKGIEGGILVDARDQDETTALHSAAKNVLPECMAALIKGGANVNLLDGPKVPAIHWVTATREQARRGRAFECLKLLLEAGADPNWNQSDSRYQTLRLAVDGWSGDKGCWPEAVDLLLKYGADPTKARLFPIKKHKGSSKEYIETVATLWKATYFDSKYNPSRPTAVWFSRALFTHRSNEFETFFAAVHSKEGAGNPGTLIQFLQSLNYRYLNSSELRYIDPAEFTITRLSPGGGPDKVIPVNLTELIREGKDFALQWGDVVELPVIGVRKAKDDPDLVLLQKRMAEPFQIEVRLQVGENHVFQNNSGSDGSETFEVMAPGGKIHISDLQRLAGLPAAYFLGDAQVRRVGKDGSMAPPQEHDFIYHGDLIEVSSLTPKRRISQAERVSGVHLCTNLDGPYWFVKAPAQNSRSATNSITTTSTPLAGLVLALMAPHGLDLKPVDWDKATFRSWHGQKWNESTVKDAIVKGRTLDTACLIVLPELGSEKWQPSQEWQDLLTEKLKLDWKLAIDDAPLVDASYVPPFFQTNFVGDQWVWSDLDPKATRRPLFPIARDLLWVHPLKEKFRTNVMIRLYDTHTSVSNLWLRPTTKLGAPVLSVDGKNSGTGSTSAPPAKKPPAPAIKTRNSGGTGTGVRTPPTPGPRPNTGRPSRVRRVPTPPAR